MAIHQRQTPVLCSIQVRNELLPPTAMAAIFAEHGFHVRLTPPADLPRSRGLLWMLEATPRE